MSKYFFPGNAFRTSLCGWLLVFATVMPFKAEAVQFGLDARPVNNTCLAFDRPNTNASIDVVRVFPSLPLYSLQSAVVSLTQLPNESSYWYFATGHGYIGRFANTPTVSTWEEVLDIRSKVSAPAPADGGLIQMIFHPNFPIDPRVFFNYSAPGTFNEDHDIIVSSFETTDGGQTLDPSTETILVRQPRGPNHQGGFMAFDNDGLLYIGFGDGDTQKDPHNFAQDLTDLRGSILRIDINNVSPGQNYDIPVDNPYAGNPRCGPVGNTAACPEIFAFGFRNPFRGDIDPVTGDIWISDVGLSLREETNKVQNGGNYGWNVFEGTFCHEYSGSCSDTSLIPPVVEYDHVDGQCAVIGGYVYRGSTISELHGRYLFADFCSSKISAIQYDTDGNPFEEILLPGGTGIGSIYTFGKGSDGELYVVTRTKIHKIVDNSSGGSVAPATLSQTGCFDAVDPTIPASGLIPFDVKSKLWTDGAFKRRWIALPEGGTVDIDTDGDFLFPPGTVLAKEFSFDGVPVETRLFVHHLDGIWVGYSYEWRNDGADADLLPAGKVKTLSSGLNYTYPSRAECLSCHTSDANFTLGPEVAQLNNEMFYPESFRIANQLQTLDHIGVFTAGLPAAIEDLQTFAAIDDMHHSIHYRARSYLHSNCSGCHRPGEVTQAPMDFRFSNTMADINACNVTPVFGDLGVSGAKIISPGNPNLSVTMLRDGSRDPLIQMPPLGTSIVHNEWITLLDNWISDTSICDADIDSDLDGIYDKLDNCPTTSNTNQRDTDKNGIGDGCELTANAGTDVYIADLLGNGSESVNLDGSESTSPNPADPINSWTWRKDGSVIASGELSSANLPIGVHTIDLEIVTTLGNSDTDTLIVTVGSSSGNFHPVADAGPDQTVGEGVTAQLDGSRSSDPNNDSLTYLWLQTNGLAVTLSDATAEKPDFTTPTGLLPGEQLIFSLVVNDGEFSSTQDTISITIDNTPPSVPQNLMAAAISDTAISLGWDASTDAGAGAGIQHYEVARGGTVIATATGTSHTDTGRSPNTLYTYTVRAVDNAGNISNWSAPASDSTLPPLVNLALGAPTVASSVEWPGTHRASKAVDGNVSSRWSSEFSDPQWIYVDLSAVYTIERVVLKWEAGYAEAYEIQVSDDALNWVTVFGESNGTGGRVDLALIPVSARYIRLMGLQRGTQWGYSLWEFEVYGSSTPPEPPVLTSLSIAPATVTVTNGTTQTFTATALDQYGAAFPTPVGWLVDSGGAIDENGVFTAATVGGPYTVTATAAGGFTDTAAVMVEDTAPPPSGNLALGVTVVASSVEKPGASADNAVDGNTSSRWSSKFTDSEWIYADLGAVYTIERVVLKWEAAYGKSYEIQVSDDALGWVTVYSMVNGDGGIDDISFAPVNARYIRVMGLQRGTQWGYSLFEFEVYGPSTPLEPPVLTSLSVAPATVTVTNGTTQIFTAAALDQYGAVYPTPVDWSVDGGGTIDGNGVFTAAAVGGPYTVTTATGGITATAVVTVVDTAPPPPGNLALGANVAASSVEKPGASADNAVDGNASSRWSSKFTDSEWIYADLGAVYTIERVVLKWEAAFGKSYEIQVSDDALGWVTVYSMVNGDGGIDDISFAQVNARYIRVMGLQRGTQWGYSLFEFEVYGPSTPLEPPVLTSLSVAPATVTVTNGTTQIFTAAALDQYGAVYPTPVDWSVDGGGTIDGNGVFTAAAVGGPYTVTTATGGLTATAVVTVVDTAPPPPGNLALGANVAASSVEKPGASADNAVDGNASSRWSSKFTDSEWIYADLGAVYTIERVVLKWEAAYGKSYEIQVSDDALGWVTVYSMVNGDGGIDDISLAVVNARYIRVMGLERGTPWGYSLWEFEVYGAWNSSET